MPNLADGRATVGQDRQIIFLCGLRDGGVRYAVLRHHPAHQQFRDAQLAQDFFEVRLLKRVGVLFNDG